MYINNNKNVKGQRDLSPIPLPLYIRHYARGKKIRVLFKSPNIKYLNNLFTKCILYLFGVSQ